MFGPEILLEIVTETIVKPSCCNNLGSHVSDKSRYMSDLNLRLQILIVFILGSFSNIFSIYILSNSNQTCLTLF